MPLVARPPACSMMKAMGMHSYRSLSLPRGAALVPGYMKIPPYWGARLCYVILSTWSNKPTFSVLCTSATMDPIYLAP